MTEENASLVKDLYGLRAGLSVISQIKDEIDTVVDKTIKLNRELKNKEKDFYRQIEQNDVKIAQDRDKLLAYNNKLNIKEKEISNIESKRNDGEKSLDFQIQTEEKKLNYNKKKVKEYNWKIAITIIGFIIAVTFMSGLIFYLIPDKLVEKLYLSSLNQMIGILLAWVNIILIIVFAVKKKKWTKELKWSEREVNNLKYKLHSLMSENKKTYYKNKQNNDNEISKLKLEISFYSSEIAILEEENKSCELELEILNIKKARFDLLNVLIARIVKEKCNQSWILYEELKKEYSDKVDVRDWKNIDLIIYNFETGRADSKKEALQLLDRERQTDRIISSVQFASKQIGENMRAMGVKIISSIGSLSYNLSSKLSTLSKNMSYGFTALENQANNNKKVMQEMTHQLNSNNNLLIGEIKELVSEQKLSNSLLEKSNESSIELMKDVERVRWLNERKDLWGITS